MTSKEYLEKIKAKCQELLEIAEKRTPGEWKSCNGQKGTIIRRKSANVIGEPQDVARAWNCWRKYGNAAFIASCAGPAEAGWRATIAAIDSLETIPHSPNCMMNHYYFGNEKRKQQAIIGCNCRRRDQEQAIIAAWPEELLK